MRKIVWPVFVVAVLLLMVGVALGIVENGGSVGAGLFFAGAVLGGALWVAVWMAGRDA